MRKLLSLCLFTLLLFNLACTEEEEKSTILVTEDVLYASGEQVRLLGRLISNQHTKANDHGFYLSTDENFSSPIILSLGVKEGAGRFIGEIDGLTVGSNYYAKSFMDIGNGLEFGNVLEVKTLNPGLESFLPKFGSANQQLTILGRNFTKDTEVYFGEVRAEILKVDFESRLLVRIPASTDLSLVPITVKVQDQTLKFEEPFEYQTGLYHLIGEFPEQVKLYNNISFQNGAGFYIGLGRNAKNQFYEGFQRYNPTSSTWEKINWPGAPSEFAFATSSYIGGGSAALTREPYIRNNEFWKVSSSGFQQLADLPFDSRESLAFEVNQDLFVLGGKEGDSLAVRKYTASTQQWSSRYSSPVAFSGSNPHFVYQDKVYLIDNSAVLWAYDPINDFWENTGLSYPGSLGQGYGIAHVIDQKVYIGLYKRAVDFWELDLTTWRWKSKNTIPGIPQSVTVGSFVAGKSIYIMRVPDISVAGSFPMELYQFDPTGI